MNEQTKRCFFSLSQMQRRVAKEYRNDARDAENEGKRTRAAEYWQKSKNLWRSAFFNLNLAR